MALEHAVLVSLREQAASGYELARRFDRSIGHFWQATHQQLYRVLKRMEEAGWVRSERIPQSDRPDKKVYEVTPDGHAELSRWIAQQDEPAPLRSDLAVKVRGATDPADRRALAAEVRRQRDIHAARLDLYLQFEKADFADPERLDTRGRLQHLVLRGGIRFEEGAIGWCDEVLATLRELAAQSAGSRPEGD